MAESATTKTKRGSVLSKDIPRITELITTYPRHPKNRNIQWAKIAEILKGEGVQDSANKFLTGRALLEKWTNYLDPSLNTKDPFTPDEWQTLTNLYIKAKGQRRTGRKSGKYLLPLGPDGVPVKWYGLLKHRSPNMVKNLYNTSSFIEAAEAAYRNGGRVVLPAVSVMPQANPISELDEDDVEFLLEAIGDDDKQLDLDDEERALSVPRSDSAPPSPGYGYAPPGYASPDYASQFVGIDDGYVYPSSPGGAALPYGFSPSPPRFGPFDGGGKAYKKARKSSRKARKSSRKARKSSRKARKSSRK
jgi:hypothetical protein